MPDDRAERDALEQLQVEVRALRATLAQADDASILEPPERERDALQAQLAQALRELKDLEDLRARREVERAGSAREAEFLRAREVQLVDELAKLLVTGHPDQADQEEW